MDDNTRLIRNLLAVAALVGIAELTELDLILSGLMRPMLVTLAHLFAIQAVDQGTAVQLGKVVLSTAGQGCTSLDPRLLRR
jgi:hypothetical protein